jgi:predicted RNase H-like nuclease (RuvC/YqgF family)
VVEEEMKQYQAEIIRLNQECDRLDADDEARAVIQPRLLQLNQRWQHLQTQFMQFKKPSDSIVLESQIEPAQASLAASGVSKSSSAVITTIMTQITKVTFMARSSDFMINIGKLIVIIQQLKRHLDSLESAKIYEDFSGHEDDLKVTIETVYTFFFNFETIPHIISRG